jgi:hypothetical protein
MAGPGRSTAEDGKTCWQEDPEQGPSALDPGHALPDVPGRRKLYVIQTFHPDGAHGDWSPAEGESVVAFTRRASAERYLRQLRAARGDCAYGLFEMDLDP